MITLIVGKKGSGKTKKLIEHANQAVKQSNGNVVVIEKGLKLTYDISHQARLIDTDAYGIQGADALSGFISGICAGNYDVTDIYVDSTLKIIGQDMKAFTAFAEKMNTLSNLANTKITLLVSADTSDLPEEINSVAVQI
jgi:energy-coupling factor transporter ATP-binding protein EcfA2